MRRVVLRGLLTRKLRTVLTSLAILLGVAMIAGTFVLTDQIDSAFSDIFHAANVGTDVVLTHQTTFDTQNGSVASMPDSLIATVRRVPGVAKTAGLVGGSGVLVANGKVVKSTGGAPSLVFSYTPRPFNTNDYVQGHPPVHHGEIAVIEQTAKDHHLTVGQRLTFASATGQRPVTVAGIFRFANNDSIGGATVIELTLDDAQTWLDQRGQVTSVVVAAQPGVTPSQLAARVRRAVPSSVKVETGQQNADRQTKTITDNINTFLGSALLAFAGVAVLVGAFIIFNTFSITVAQRTRELAMLRTLGATRRQVLRSVLAEALVVGVGASLVGLVAGFGIAKGLSALFDAAGFGIPLGGMQLKPRTVIVAMAVGVIVTLLASVAPALRATRVPPIAALQEGATLPPGRLSRFMPIVAGLLALGGILLIVNGLTGSGSTGQRLLGMAIGAVLIFIAVAMVAKYLVPPLAGVLGWPLRAFGPAGVIARENARRNPARTAVTSAALMIGIGLAVFVAVFAAGLKDSFTGALDRSLRSDLIVQAADAQGGGQLPVTSGRTAARVPGAGVVSPLASEQVRIGRGHGDTSLNAVDPRTIASAYRFDWQNGGSDALLGQLGTNGALVEKDTANSHHLTVGSRFGITTFSGKHATYHVVGTYKDPTLMTGFVVPLAGYLAIANQRTPQLLFISLAPGASLSDVEPAVQQALGPIADVKSNAEFKKSIEGQVNTLVILLSVLLAMSVVISIFGIVNTLVLTIYERTREIGMLRAIGTSRRQLRRMIRYESVITSIIGGILGIVVGLFFGWVVTKGLESEGLDFVVPWTQLVIFTLLAILVGVLAAIWPAVRAGRLNVLEALHYE